MTPRILLVTGGSRGIGAACCLQAASAGWDVAVNYARDAAAADRVAADVRARGRRAITVAADVATKTRCWRCSSASTPNWARWTAWSTTPAWSTSRSVWTT
jgi:NAD(P)-dependent dehydrogenase (short-subunit alcohol dehydrogenase family)